MQYEVLKPAYIGTGQWFTTVNQKTGRTVMHEYVRVEWDVIGLASGIEDAKRFCAAPVLRVRAA